MSTTNHTLPLRQISAAQEETQHTPAQIATADSGSDYDMYSATDTDDEWFNQPAHASSIRRKPLPAGASREAHTNAASNAPGWDSLSPNQGLEPRPLTIPNPHVQITPPQTLQPAGNTTNTFSTGLEGLPPAYQLRSTEFTPELRRTSTSASDVSETSLPPYESIIASSSTSSKTAPGFHPTRYLQIETKGIGLIRLPIIPPRSDPVLIRTVSHDGVLGATTLKSIQASRTSGTCVLVDGETGMPLCTTTYAPGPVRPPKLRLIQKPEAAIVTPQEASKFLKIKAPYDAEIIAVTGDKPQSRACSIRTSLGHYRWRYGTRDEKREAEGPILVFEKIREQTLPGGKKQETRKRIGQLLRSEAMRSAGSGSTAAGNGGRLMLDLNDWANKKEDSRSIEVLAVCSCMVMLRKEMNQRRLKQAATMATTAAIL